MEGIKSMVLSQWTPIAQPLRHARVHTQQGLEALALT